MNEVQKAHTANILFSATNIIMLAVNMDNYLALFSRNGAVS